MRIIDPGHLYGLAELDGGHDWHSELQFVKREGPMYPGNVGSEPGTTTQEVLRALIDRTKYVNGQEPSRTNESVLGHLRAALWELEMRAADRRGVYVSTSLMGAIEKEPACGACGHIPSAHNGPCR